MLAEGVLGKWGRFGDDDGGDGLAPLGVFDAADGAIGDEACVVERLLDEDGVHFFAACDDNGIHAAMDAEAA